LVPRARHSVDPMVEREQFADDDPEYDADAAADIGADEAAEISDLTEADPAKIPKDEGDPGQPEPREEG
jgi:hypothetical protein